MRLMGEHTTLLLRKFWGGLKGGPDFALHRK